MTALLHAPCPVDPGYADDIDPSMIEGYGVDPGYGEHIDACRLEAGWVLDADCNWMSPDGISEDDWENNGHPLPEDPDFARFMASYQPVAA